MATVYKRANAIVARDPDVRRAVKTKADEIGARARGMLAPHRVTGGHRIQVKRGRIDSFVSLVGVAATSVEFGHGEYSYRGREVGESQGLYVIHRAAGLGHF